MANYVHYNTGYVIKFIIVIIKFVISIVTSTRVLLITNRPLARKDKRIH